MAELTREVSSEFMFDSYGDPGVYLSCEQPPNTKESVAQVAGVVTRTETDTRKTRTERALSVSDMFQLDREREVGEC